MVRELKADPELDAEASRLMKGVGARIAARRRAAGLTQAEAAGHASVSLSYLQQVENFGGNLTLTALSRLARVLGVPVHRLLPESAREAAAAARLAEGAADLPPRPTMAELVRDAEALEAAVARHRRRLAALSGERPPDSPGRSQEGTVSRTTRRADRRVAREGALPI